MYEVKFNEAENHLYVVGEEQYFEETNFGEAMCTIPLPNGRSIEICHESEGLEKPFFSVRLISSEDEFDKTDESILHDCNADTIEEVNEHSIPVMLSANRRINL